MNDLDAPLRVAAATVDLTPRAGLPLGGYLLREGKTAIGAHDPLYTTYAAPLSRSEYLVDEGYFLNYFSSGEGVTYATDTSGRFALGWRLGKGRARP